MHISQFLHDKALNLSTILFSGSWSKKWISWTQKERGQIIEAERSKSLQRKIISRVKWRLWKQNVKHKQSCWRSSKSNLPHKVTCFGSISVKFNRVVFVFVQSCFGYWNKIYLFRKFVFLIFQVILHCHNQPFENVSEFTQIECVIFSRHMRQYNSRNFERTSQIH